MSNNLKDVDGGMLEVGKILNLLLNDIKITDNRITIYITINI